MNRFQTIIFGIFIGGAVLGVLAFSGVLPTRNSTEGTASGSVVLWGTIDQVVVKSATDRINNENKDFSVSYVQKNRDSFNQDLVEALARGEGPDLVFLSQENLLRHQDKLAPIPYESFPERSFRDLFVQEGELFLSDAGTLLMPVFVDPLVLYYNRSILEGAGISGPPKFWDEFHSFAPRVTILGPLYSVARSFVAMGESINVLNFKEIISTLILQLNNPIISYADVGGTVSLQSNLSDTFGYQTSPSILALDFFSEFSNPTKSSYSWNKSMPRSDNAFTAGDTAIYLGYASELFSIQSRNPNLDFDVAVVPQSRESSTPKTFGKITGIGVLNSSKNISTAYTTAFLLSTGEYAFDVATGLSLPPARRDLLASRPANPYVSVFYDSALISRGWLDPNQVETSNIFSEMIENVSSGRLAPSSAVNRANGQLQFLLNQ